jgi:hypothetical protein
MEHDYFGIIDETFSGGLVWSDPVDVAEQSVEVSLTAEKASSVRPVALDSAASMIQGLEAFDSRARDALVAQLDERASVTTEYVNQSSEELGESLLDILVDNSGDLAIDVLRSLQLVSVAFSVENAGDGEEFAVFAYSISPDDTDTLLLVSFDIRGDVVAVETEE